jgi:hypothetical protein
MQCWTRPKQTKTRAILSSSRVEHGNKTLLPFLLRPHRGGIVKLLMQNVCSRGRFSSSSSSPPLLSLSLSLSGSALKFRSRIRLFYLSVDQIKVLCRTGNWSREFLLVKCNLFYIFRGSIAKRKAFWASLTGRKNSIAARTEKCARSSSELIWRI